MSAQSDIAELYVGYFNRAPDPAGLSYWVARNTQGMSIDKIAQSFSEQPEARGQYAYLSNQTQTGATAFINEVYNNLFGRNVEPAGLQYWLNDLAQRGSPSLMVLAMINGALGDDALAVQNQVSVGIYYATELVEHSKAWSPQSAVSVLDEVDHTSLTLSDGYYEVDQYILNGAINPPNLTPGTPVNPTWPEPPVTPPVTPPLNPPVTPPVIPPVVVQPPIIPPVITDPITNLPPPIGPLLADVIGATNNILAQALTLNVGNLLGGILGGILGNNTLDLLDVLNGNTIGNLINLNNGVRIDLSDLNLPAATQIANLGTIADLTINDVFTDQPIARVAVGGQSLLLVDVNHNEVFDAGIDIQLLGAANLSIGSFII